jgi:hypothetical protein
VILGRSLRGVHALSATFIVDVCRLIPPVPVALLSAFLVLYLWMLWAYFKVSASNPQLDSVVEFYSSRLC